MRLMHLHCLVRDVGRINVQDSRQPVRSLTRGRLRPTDEYFSQCGLQCPKNLACSDTSRGETAIDLGTVLNR